MIGFHLQELLSISSAALCSSEPSLPSSLLEMAGAGADRLVELLQERNGFYAFEHALHVLPSNCVNNTSTIDLERWNMNVCWRSEFGTAAEGLLFFAEDVLGEQFALSDGKVWRFNPESGERLIPKPPFILGGKYEIDNLFALDAVKGMRYRADILETNSRLARRHNCSTESYVVK